MAVFRLILNVIWVVLCGWWMAILYALAGIICFILIITIPLGIASFRIAGFCCGRSDGTLSGGPRPGSAR